MISDAHPAYQKAPPAFRWPVGREPAELWGRLNEEVRDTAPESWCARMLVSGTVVALRVAGGVRELRIGEPALPGDGALRNFLHARWAREVDELRSAFGVRGWDKLEGDGESVWYVDRPRPAEPEPVFVQPVREPEPVKEAPAAPLYALGDLFSNV